MDVTEAVAAIAAVTAAVALVGAAKLLPAAAVSAWAMLKSAVGRG